MRQTAFGKTGERIAKKALPCFLTSMLTMLLILPAFAADKQKDEDTLQQANIVLTDMLNSKDISPAVLGKADCVVILPGVKKFGFGVGGSGGRGPMLCRTGQKFEGKWSAPAMYTIGGASLGLQIGGSSSDFVLLLMDSKVVMQVLQGKTKMGADATAAAGPGATAAGPVDNADILTYGRAKGLFAGASLGSATLEPDNDANFRLYGKRLVPSDIVRSTTVKATSGGEPLVTLLDGKLATHSE
jgi:SH3 domain-containing YSC84-like protein 1